MFEEKAGQAGSAAQAFRLCDEPGVVVMRWRNGVMVGIDEVMAVLCLETRRIASFQAQETVPLVQSPASADVKLPP